MGRKWFSSMISSSVFWIQADEQRYDAEYKIEKNNKETEELKRKHAELKGFPLCHQLFLLLKFRIEYFCFKKSL